MKKYLFFIFFILLVFVFNNCKSVTTIESIPTSFEVPVTGIGVSGYVEVYVSNEPQGDISIIKNNFYYKIANLSHTYSMDLTLMICIEGDATEDNPKIYTKKQPRWDDSSKTVVLASTSLVALESKSFNTESGNQDVLLKLLKQDGFWIVVKNYIPSSYANASYTNTPQSSESTSTVKITYPQSGEILRDGKVRIRGVYNSSTYTTGVSIYLNDILKGNATTSGDNWYYDLDLTVIPYDSDVTIKAEATSLANSVSDSVSIKFSPAASVTDFFAQLKIESDVVGGMSLFSIF